jgi:hypothetical protein
MNPPVITNVLLFLRGSGNVLQHSTALYVIPVPCAVVSHLKILIPVNTAMIIVADVQYDRVSRSVPTVNM